MEDKIKILYNTVGKEYNLGTEDEFRQKLSDPEKRKALYSAVGKKYNLGSYDEFEAKIGQKKSPQTTSPNGSNGSLVSESPSTLQGITNQLQQNTQAPPAPYAPTATGAQTAMQSAFEEPLQGAGAVQEVERLKRMGEQQKVKWNSEVQTQEPISGAYAGEDASRINREIKRQEASEYITKKEQESAPALEGAKMAYDEGLKYGFRPIADETPEERKKDLERTIYAADPNKTVIYDLETSAPVILENKTELAPFILEQAIGKDRVSEIRNSGGNVETLTDLDDLTDVEKVKLAQTLKRFVPREAFKQLNPEEAIRQGHKVSDDAVISWEKRTGKDVGLPFYAQYTNTLIRSVLDEVGSGIKGVGDGHDILFGNKYEQGIIAKNLLGKSDSPLTIMLKKKGELDFDGQHMVNAAYTDPDMMDDYQNWYNKQPNKDQLPHPLEIRNAREQAESQPNPLIALGGGIKNFAESLSDNPEFQKDYINKYIGLAGSTVPYLAAAALTGGASAGFQAGVTGLMGAMSTGAREYENAMNADADPGTAWNAYLGGSIAGSTTAIPIHYMFNAINKAGGGSLVYKTMPQFLTDATKNLAWESAKSGNAEAIQELLQAAISNLSASQTYDAAREILSQKEMIETGKDAFVIGAALPFMIGGLKIGVEAQLQKAKVNGDKEAASKMKSLLDEIIERANKLEQSLPTQETKAPETKPEAVKEKAEEVKPTPKEEAPQENKIQSWIDKWEEVKKENKDEDLDLFYNKVKVALNGYAQGKGVVDEFKQLKSDIEAFGKDRKVVGSGVGGDVDLAEYDKKVKPSGIPLNEMDKRDFENWVGDENVIDGKIKVYRGTKVKGAGLRKGDFVTTDKEYAKTYGENVTEHEIPIEQLNYFSGVKGGDAKQVGEGLGRKAQPTELVYSGQSLPTQEVKAKVVGSGVGGDVKLSDKDLQDNGVSFIKGASHLAKENGISNEAAELQHIEAGNEIMAIVNDGLSKGKSGNEIVSDVDKIFNEKLRSLPSNTRAVIEQIINQKASDLPSVLKEAEAIDAEIKSLREEDGSVNNKDDIQKFKELRDRKTQLLFDAGVNNNAHLKEVIAEQQGKDKVVGSGVGGDLVEPKTQNFTQFAKENGYPDDYDTSFQAQLLGGRGLEGQRQSNRSIKEQDNAFQEMQNKKAEGKKAYEQAILDGKVIDPDGKLTREGILKRDYDFDKKELESKIANAESGIKNIEGLGKMAHLDNGKLKKGYQRAVDDYNETISKHKATLDKLKTEYDKAAEPVPEVKSEAGEDKKTISIFHGTTAEIAKEIEANGFDVEKGADGTMWFTSNKSKIESGEVGASVKGGIVERTIDESNLKLGGYDEQDKYSTGELINMGYDGLKLVDEGEITYQIFQPNKLGKKLAQSTPEAPAKPEADKDGITKTPDNEEAKEAEETVLGKEGNIPSTVYHATNVDFEGLPTRQEKSKVHGFGQEPSGVFYSTSEEGAKKATGAENQRIIPANIEPKNPLVIENTGDKIYDDLLQDAKAEIGNKHGVTVKEIEDGDLPNDTEINKQISDRFSDKLKEKGYDAVYNKENGDVIVLDEGIMKPKAITKENAIRQKVKKVKTFTTENGRFSVYDTDAEHSGRADMFTVEENEDGWIVKNALIPDELQKQGIATDFYIKMNNESLKATGNPLRSTQPRKLVSGEVVHELSKEGIKLWDSLVRNGHAEKLGEKDYQFLKPPTAKTTKTVKVSERQSEINSLVDKVRDFNKMSYGARGKSSANGQRARMQIKELAKALGLKYVERGKSIVIKTKNGKLIRKNMSGDGNRAAAETHTPLENRKKETQDFFNLLNESGTFSFPEITGEDGKRMSSKQINAAVADIINGTPTKAAESLLNHLDATIESGDVNITDPNSRLTVAVPLAEYISVLREANKKAETISTEEENALAESFFDFLDKQPKTIQDEYYEKYLEEMGSETDAYYARIGGISEEAPEKESSGGERITNHANPVPELIEIFSGIWGQTKKQAQASAEIFTAYAKGLERYGIKAKEFWENLEFRKGGEGGKDPLFQEAKGSFHVENTKRILTALTDPNISTPVHELAHAHLLTVIDLAKQGNQLAVKDLNTIIAEHNKSIDSGKWKGKRIGSVEKLFESAEDFGQLFQAMMQGGAATFEEYSNEAIGSGEGGMARGWGHYFTSAEALQEHYANVAAMRKANTLNFNTDAIEINGEKVQNEFTKAYPDIAVKSLGMTKPDFLKTLAARVETAEKIAKKYPDNKSFQEIAKQGREIYALAEKADVKPHIPRVLTNVEYKKGQKLSDHEFLDFDNEATEEQIKAIQKQAKIKGIEIDTTGTGEEIYWLIAAEVGGNKEASHFLLEAGIEGNKYHARSDGATNWVIFNPKNITIESQKLFQKPGVQNSQYQSVQEFFARSFERYLRDPDTTTFSAKFKEVLESFAEFMRDLYKKIVGPEIDIEVTPEMRKIFEDMFGAETVKADFGEQVNEEALREEVKNGLLAKQQQLSKIMGQEDTPESEEIIRVSLFPLKQAIQFVSKPLNRIQEKIFGEQVDKVKEWVSKKIKEGAQSANTIKRQAAQFATSWSNGLPRTQEDLKQKRFLKGNIALANENFAENIERLHALVGNSVESLERVHQVLDPEFYEENPTLFEDKVTFDDLTKNEKALALHLRAINEYVHDWNFAMGMIGLDTYIANKGKYIARLYEPFEVPQDAKEFLEKGDIPVINKQAKLIEGLYKAREEINDWKKQNIIRDPVFLTAKRMMQTEVNAAVLGYIEHVAAQKGMVSKTEKKGFTQLNGKGYGSLNGAYVPNYIAEDFKGYFFGNQIVDLLYDVSKVYDRTQVRQFLKKYYTVFNPAVQLGNNSSNFVFAFLSGIDPTTMISQYPAAIREVNQKGAIYKLLLKNGILGSDVITGDLRPLTKTTEAMMRETDNAKGEFIERGKRLAGWLDKKITDIYSGSDDVAKIAAFKALKDYGYSDEKAIELVYNGFQNYATVGKIWDLAAKVPVFGNPFIKFTADLQRILTNAALRRPLSTAMFIGLLRATAQLASNWSDEDEEEKQIREGRKFIPKIPLPKILGGNVPLVFQTPAGEVNLARYLSPFYIYDTGDTKHPIEDISKFLPFQVKLLEGAERGSKDIYFPKQDPLLGTWIAAVIDDVDFRGVSVQDPTATRFRSSGVTTKEKILNAVNYIARSQIPFYSSTTDVISAWSYGTDFYGRDKSPAQVIMSNFIKVQDFKGTKYRETIEKEFTNIEWNVKGYEDQLKGINQYILKEAGSYAEKFKNGQISEQQYERKYNDLIKSQDKRQLIIIEKIAAEQNKMNELVMKYKNILD